MNTKKEKQKIKRKAKKKIIYTRRSTKCKKTNTNYTREEAQVLFLYRNEVILCTLVLVYSCTHRLQSLCTLLELTV